MPLAQVYEWTKVAMRQFSTSPTKGKQNQPKPDDYQPDGEKDNPDKEQNPDEEEKMPFLARLMLMVWLGFLVYIVLRLVTGDDGSMYKFVSWNEFVHDMLAKGEVEEVIVRPETEMAYIRLHPDAVIRGRKLDSEVFTLKIADADKFEEKVRKVEEELGIRPENGISISYQRENAWASLVFMAIVGLALFMIFRNMVKVQLPNPSDMFASERKAKFVRVDLQTQKGHGITFKEVAGMQEAKTEVMEFVDYLKTPERFKGLGAKIPRGALLLGPPGCGKTLLAKAVATEAKVPFLAMAGSEFVEMLGGLGAARVRDLFKTAKEKAPCIIYLDEIDAIGRRRGGQNLSEGASEEEHTLNQLLVEMDGIGTAEGVIMLASTNRPDVLDKALLRPGRFDRHIQIELPTLSERVEIFEIYLEQLRLAKQANQYSERLAQLSPGMSGADICNICNEAALHAARDKKPTVDKDDFDYAVERVVAGVAKKSRILSVQEKKVVAYHEAGHALVGWLLQYTDALLRVSIVPRVGSTLGFAQYMPSDRKLYSKQELFERMCMGMGGRVAESLIFNSVTSGAQDDLRKITKTAYMQIRQLGMNDRVGLVSFDTDDQKFGNKPYSKHLARVIDEEVRLLVAEAYKETEKILLQNKDKLRLIAEALLEKESLSYQDMEQLVGPPPYEKETGADWDSLPKGNPETSTS